MTDTAPQLQPLYLLADSQLLFWKRHDRPLLDAALDGLPRDTPLSAAYIGASNGDRPEYYGIFEAAVDAIGITDRRMIERPAVRCFAFTAAVSRSSEGGGSGPSGRGAGDGARVGVHRHPVGRSGAANATVDVHCPLTVDQPRLVSDAVQTLC